MSSPMALVPALFVWSVADVEFDLFWLVVLGRGSIKLGQLAGTRKRSGHLVPTTVLPIDFTDSSGRRCSAISCSAKSRRCGPGSGATRFVAVAGCVSR